MNKDICQVCGTERLEPCGYCMCDFGLKPKAKPMAEDKVRPITPKDVVKQKLKDIPDIVIQTWNKAIAKNYDGKCSIITQSEIVNELKNVTNKDNISGLGWLDIEEIYRAAGWEVIYDKPGYNESYAATFTFKEASNG